MSSDLIINAPPFFCLDAVWWHAIRLFLCLCLRLNCKDLSLFGQNGEFEKSAFWRAEIRQNPPNSPFGDFGGHGNLQSCKCFICRTFFWKISLFFLFLQWVQRRILFCEPSSFEYFLWQSKSYKVVRDFCFHLRCTPEYRYCGVTDCHFWFSPQAVILSSNLELNSILAEEFDNLIEM